MVHDGLVAACDVGGDDHGLEALVDGTADGKDAGDGLGMERQDVVDEGRADALAYQLEVIDDAELLLELVEHLKVGVRRVGLAVGGIDHVHRGAIRVDMVFHAEVADDRHGVAHGTVGVDEINRIDRAVGNVRFASSSDPPYFGADTVDGLGLEALLGQCRKGGEKRNER